MKKKFLAFALAALILPCTLTSCGDSVENASLLLNEAIELYGEENYKKAIKYNKENIILLDDGIVYATGIYDDFSKDKLYKKKVGI